MTTIKQSKLLIIEDDSIMGMEMRELLEFHDYEVLDIVSEGEEAIKIVKIKKPDLILMDIRLNGKMTGLEAAKILRTFSKIPILFITGYKDETVAREVANIPLSFLKTKPVDFDELIKLIKDIL